MPPRPTSPRPFSPLLLALPLLLAASDRRASAGPDPTTDIHVGAPVGLDGIVNSGEWDDATVCSMGPAGPELRVKQARGTLMLSLATSRPWPRQGRFLLYAVAAAEDASWQAPGAIYLDFEPFEHNRPHALVRRKTEVGWQRLDGEVVLRTSGIDAAATLEGAVPLSLLGVSDPKARLRWLAALSMPGHQPSHATFPVGLDIGATAGGPPKDLATTERWALTTDFPDVKGPGAFPKKEWDAWTAADRELTERGEKAHALALSLMGEIGTGGTDERPKRDAEIVDGLVAPLRWIAAKERLTHADVRAMATGFWRLNRAPEGLAWVESAAAADPGLESPDDERLAAMIATDAERYDDAAAHWERLAGLLPERMAPPYLGAARVAREFGVAWQAEQAARAEDDAKDDQPLAVLSTSKGDVTIRLLEDDVPESVAQFVHLAEAAKAEDGKPFYAGTLFHRVVAAGVAQGGDPKSRTEGCEAAGSGGSSWWIAPQVNARHGFFRGSVGWAMGADKKVRSQFFVMTAPKPQLRAQGFPCFGTVIGGMDVVDRLEACDTLRSVTILRKRDHPYEPKKSY